MHMAAPLDSREPRHKGLIAVCVLTLIALTVHTRCAKEDRGHDEPGPPRDADVRPAGQPNPLIAQGRVDTSEDSAFERLLLVGFDRSEGEIGRTDAILVVVANRLSSEVGVVSIPRDLWVDIPGHEPGRINAVVRIGERLRGQGGGLELLEEVLAEQLGLSVTAAVAVSFDGFTEIIDGLGGVDVDVRCPIEDRFLSKGAEGGYEPLSLAAGEQRLDGHTALLYSRSRHGRSDADRSFRQQAVLLGVKKRVLRTGALPRLPRLWRSLAANTVTDLDLNRALSFAMLFASVDTSRVHGLVIAPPIVEEARSADGKWILLPDRAKVATALERLFDAPPMGARPRAPCPPADVALHWRGADKDAPSTDSTDTDANPRSKEIPD